MREVRLSQLATVFEDLDYPLTREAVREQSHDVTLLLVEGTVDLDAVLQACDTPVFESIDELLGEVMRRLPEQI
ncbi:MAG: hypothetical protein ABEJ08_02655 [Halobacteriaceae archaeon]